MTLGGAIKQLQQLQNAEDMPFYYKPAIAEVINVLLMDTQEIRHGHWINHFDDLFPEDSSVECSVCHEYEGIMANDNYCPNCGARMDEVTFDKDTNVPIREERR